MGLFAKKEKKEEAKKINSGVPELPELPRLPEFPSMTDFHHDEETLPQLPKFPNNSLGNRFSQNTIKEAVTGKEEDDEVFEAEDLPEEPEEEVGMVQKPLQRYSREDDNYQKSEISKQSKTKEVPSNFVIKNSMTKKAEPIFIRLDKFEESMKIFQEIKNQVSEMEVLIKNVKDIKTKEDEELASWKKEVQSIKNQIEKVNQDIFSRIE